MYIVSDTLHKIYKSGQGWRAS